ncbi:MAG: Wzz/FepE/Etk N-terminal domain-containing protein, partial [Gammaproteobacteria bacterium]|nr:Wzz/FepE/Etk N-terminal domain-containing protein [Gammaproteobacteria bacterium]
MLNESGIKAGIQSARGVQTVNAPSSYLQYIVAIRRYKWSILGLAVIAAFIAGLVSLTLPSVYKAKSILLIEPPQTKV